MPRHSDDPVRHIVTFRVNSEEKELLENLAKQSGRSISEFMRRRLQSISEDDKQMNMSIPFTIQR